MLPRRGKQAKGEAYDYLVDERMLGGLVLVAYRAPYRTSGIVTVIVNHDGIVCEAEPLRG